MCTNVAGVVDSKSAFNNDIDAMDKNSARYECTRLFEDIAMKYILFLHVYKRIKFQ